MTDAYHRITVHFDGGDYDYLTLECLASGSGRVCAVIECPVDHEDVSQACIEAHGAKALDECWAVRWFEAGGRESMDTEALRSIRFPVSIDFDDGILVDNAGSCEFVPDEGQEGTPE